MDELYQLLFKDLNNNKQLQDLIIKDNELTEIGALLFIVLAGDVLKKFLIYLERSNK